MENDRETVDRNGIDFGPLCEVRLYFDDPRVRSFIANFPRIVAEKLETGTPFRYLDSDSGEERASTIAKVEILPPRPKDAP